MVNKMLVVLDNSEHSLNSLKQSLALARSEGCQLELVSVVPTYDGDLRLMGSTSALDEERSAFQEILDRGVEMAHSFNMSVKPALLEGEPFEEINRLANQSGTDLIVLNKKNPYHMDLIPVGAVATKVIGQSEKDVLVISKESSLTLEKIVLAYDNSANAKKAAHKAIELALDYGSELTIASVFEVPLEGFAMSPDLWSKIGSEAGQVQESIAEMAREKGVRKVETVLRSGTTYLELIKLSQEIQAGLIMMGAMRKRGVLKFRLGNVMERVICNGSIPVWVVNN